MSYGRLRRDDPERTGPIRNFSTTFRRSTSWGDWGTEGEEPGWAVSGEDFGTGEEATYGDAWAGDVPPDDAAASGVRLGYRMLDEQMRRGAQIAQQMTGLLTPQCDLREVTERIFRFYADLSAETATFWLDLVTSCVLPKLPPDGRPPVRSDSAVKVEIFSSRPAKATVQLPPNAAALPLQACQLWSRDPTKPPLMDVAFVRVAGQPVLRVRIPDNQPPDLYLGVICDRRTGEALGTVSIDLRGS
jgi:hypothetical protein